jgi:hypothetical protein
MTRTASILLLFLLAVAGIAANDKDKAMLPSYVLSAQTVAVVIQPDAGEPLTDPTANRKAQEEVEKALMKWGRFRLVTAPLFAELVITVRKGTAKVATPTIKGGPVDSRPVILEKTDGKTRVGVQQGRPPGVTRESDESENSRPRLGMEVGPAEDMFSVYRGGTEDSLGTAPVWTYSAKDALRGPGVQAVEQFRKAIDAAEKAAQKRQNKKP